MNNFTKLLLLACGTYLLVKTLSASKSMGSADKDASIPLPELISEHKRLVKVLKSGNKEAIRKEAEIQEKELQEYLDI